MCGHRGIPDRFGCCAGDESCKVEMFVQALHAGEAKKLRDGTIVWDRSKYQEIWDLRKGV